MKNETKEISIGDTGLWREKVVLLKGELWVLFTLESLADYLRAILNGDVNVAKGFCNKNGDMAFRPSDLEEKGQCQYMK